MDFLPSTQMMPPHLLHFKKIRTKYKIHSQCSLSHTRSPVFFFFFILVFGHQCGSQIARDPPTQPPWVTVGQARPNHESGHDPGWCSPRTILIVSGHLLRPLSHRTQPLSHWTHDWVWLIGMGGVVGLGIFSQSSDGEPGGRWSS
jgi:hypothetical protein